MDCQDTFNEKKLKKTISEDGEKLSVGEGCILLKSPLSVGSILNINCSKDIHFKKLCALYTKQIFTHRLPLPVPLLWELCDLTWVSARFA